MKIRLNDEQALAAETLEGPVLVTAGAGSGKTRMLTERFANAVVPGRLVGWNAVDARSVVAITYTEKAAREISERVRAEIPSAGSGCGAQSEDLWISTIHGFCTRVLRQHPFEAGIDPLFAVADSLESGRMRERAFRDALTEFDGEDGRLRELLDAWGADAVFAAVLEIERELAVAGLTSDAIGLETALSVSRLLEEAQALFSDGVSTCDIDYTGTSTGHMDHAEQCQGLLLECAIVASLDHSEQATLERVLDLAEGYKPIKKLKGFEQLNEVGSARKQRLVARAAAAVTLPYAEMLRELTVGYGRLYRQFKQTAGVLDFEDLQTLAVNLLDRRPEIAARYRERFRVVMIDEFQDTDALQLRLVEMIAGQNLCTVGDEMQAIYGFRGADVDVYRRHRAAMREAGALVAELATNYRSHPEILGFVNGVFGSEQYEKNDTLPLNPAAGGRESHSLDTVLGDRPRVEVLFVDAGVESLGSARKREAAEIAERLAELREHGLDLGDVAILLRAYTDAHIYADALAKRGLAATVVGGGRFFGLEETAVMRALTRVIASAADEAALGVLLVSEFVPVADEALLRLRVEAAGQHRSLWELMCSDMGHLDPVDAEALRRLREVIERARTRVGREPLEDLLLKAVEEAGWDLRLLARGNIGRDAFANVAKFVRRAAEFERREGSGPAGFSAHLDAKERLGDHESPDSAIYEGARAIQIMSIHASKGLEFPVVVVPDIGRGGRNNCSIIRTKRTPSELLVAMKTPTADEVGKARAGSEWFGEFDRTDKASLEEERDRVFYVALTRARDLLMVSGAGKLNPAKRSEATDDLVKLARTLGLDVPIGDPLDRPITFDGSTVGHLSVISSGVAEAVEKQRNAQSMDALPLPFGEPLGTARKAVWLPESVSYTQLSEFERCPRQFRIRRILQIAPHPAVASSKPEPMRLGTALHAALRLLSPDGVPPGESRMRSLVEYFELDADQAKRLTDATRRYCASDVAKRTAEAEVVTREAPFSISLGGELFVLGGSVDVLARSGASALIVDYKSGVSGGPEGLSDRYRLQAECYALVALKDGCTEVDVVFVRPEVTSEGQLEQVGFRFCTHDAQRIEAKLVDQYRDIQASEYRPSPGAACANCDVPRGMCEHRAPGQTRRGAGLA